MKTKVFLLALLGLMTILWTGCKKDKDKDNVTTELSGTKWQGNIEHITVTLSFIDSECYLTSNIPGAVAKATHKTDGSQVYITITSVSGDWGGYLQKGVTLSGTYDLNQKTMVFQFIMYEGPVRITFYQI